MAASALRLGQHLKEFRFHLCQKSPASKGVRDFVEKYYVDLKRQNPKFPMLVRECRNVEPRLYARYEFGKESSLPLNDLTAEQVLQAVETLAKR